ncbi:MAG TPA: cupredoxin domain-containing protein [Mycobacteriales bacterium]|jgi:plastocyanin
MPRISRQEPKPDVLEVVHHTIPENAAAAGAPAIPGQPGVPPSETTGGTPTTEATATTATAPTATATAKATSPAPTGTGMTWRRMAATLAVTQVAAYAILLVATMLYGVAFFFPIAIAAALYAGAALWLRRGTKAGAVYTTVINALTLVMFGGLFFGWTGFMYPRSWFEMAWGTFTVLVPLAGLVACIATLRHRDGNDAAKTPIRATAAISAAVVLIGIVGSATASDATRLPGDLTLTATNLEFEQAALTAKAGDVAIYFQNDDPFEHNVKIEGRETSPNAPGGHAVRHVFRGLGAGTYTYLCAIHPDMKGTLTVT